MNQLERDIRRQIRRKLELWVDDSFDLYEMAELSPEMAIAVLMESLMRVTATIVVGMTGMESHNAAAVFYDMIEIKRQEIARRVAEAEK